MHNETELQSVEISIEQAKKMISKRDSLNRLMKNRDFKALILEGYFKEEPARLVMLKAAPVMSSEEDQKGINKEIDAIGTFRQYLQSIFAMGDQAKRSLEDDEKTREEILSGDE